MTIYESFRASGIKIIGITGRKGSGKSTFAKELGKSFAFHVPLAFADPIRSIALAVFGSEYKTQESKALVDAFWQERLGDEWSTGRAILQRLGTDVFRNGINKNIWLWAMERRLMALMARVHANHPLPLVTVDDVRFANEAEMIRNLGGRIIRMVNTNLPPNTDQHESEKGLPEDMVDNSYEIATEDDVCRVARAHGFVWSKI
jgi:hypothetical protein